MKTLLFLASLLSISITMARSDLWPQYEQFSSQFYKLVDQPFHSLNCAIEDSYLRDHADKTDSLAQLYHHITYSKKNGLGIENASLDQLIKKNPSKAENLKKHNEEIRINLTTTFAQYQHLDKSKASILEASKGHLKYIDGKDQVSIQLKQNNTTISIVNDFMKFKAANKYAPLTDTKKLVLVSGNGNATIGNVTWNSKKEISYQLVKGVTLPENIINEVRIISPNGTETKNYTLSLTNCEISSTP